MLLRRSNLSYGFSPDYFDKDSGNGKGLIKHKKQMALPVYCCGYSSKTGTVHKTVIVFSATIYESDSLLPDFYIIYYCSYAMIYRLGGREKRLNVLTEQETITTYVNAVIFYMYTFSKRFVAFFIWKWKLCKHTYTTSIVLVGARTFWKILKKMETQYPYIFSPLSLKINLPPLWSAVIWICGVSLLITRHYYNSRLLLIVDVDSWRVTLTNA